MANASNLADRCLRRLSRFLAASAAGGSTLLALGVFGGLLVPPLAHVLHPTIAPNVVLMTTLVLLRVDVPATLVHLRRPVRLGAVLGFHLLICPPLAWLAVEWSGLDAGVAAGIVIYATGCASISSAAFARMVGLDPELSLLGNLLTTLLVPLTGPPIAHLLTGVDLGITVGALMARLGVVVGVPLVASMAIRAAAGPARLAAHGPALDGMLVWAIVMFGFSIMDGLAARLIADPFWVLQATLAAFATVFGLNALTTAVFAPLGRRSAASAGMMSGVRNMALYLAVLPASADRRIALFFAICQFPFFLSPFLLRPVYARLVPASAGSVSAAAKSTST